MNQELANVIKIYSTRAHQELSNLSEIVKDSQEKKKREKITTKIICSEGVL